MNDDDEPLTAEPISITQVNQLRYDVAIALIDESHNGKLIQSGQLSGASYQELTLDADVQGAYFMNFISATERRVVKLIKM